MQSLLLKKTAVKTILEGHPWIWRGMIEMNSALEICEPGELVQICDNKAKIIGIGYFNPLNILSARVLSLKPKEIINQQFFYNIFQKALQKRDKIFSQQYYRLVHSESDNLPGLIIDRFGDILVCQTSTIGMEKLKTIWLPALQQLLAPSAIVHRDDVPARKKEGLEQNVTIYYGNVPEIVQVLEHNRIYYANLLAGQKTGWFYDQRANRSYLASISAGKNILDLYSHSGGFGIAAAKAGAEHVTMVDSSSLALDLAHQATLLNNVQNICSFVRAKAYDYLEECVKNGNKFNIIMADPPAFVKEQKHIMAGLKGYQRLANLCAKSITENGIFCIASCSHHALEPAFRRAVEDGLKKAGRKYQLLHHYGADQDHPVHRLLPESKYLKFLGYALI